jgi:hypothetical protein
VLVVGIVVGAEGVAEPPPHAAMQHERQSDPSAGKRRVSTLAFTASTARTWTLFSEVSPSARQM